MRSSASLGHPPLQWSRMCVGVTARLQQIEFEVLDRGISEHESIGLKYLWTRKYWIEVFLNTKVLGWSIYEHKNIGLKYFWTQKYWIEEHKNIWLKYFLTRKYWIEILGFRIMGTTRCDRGVTWWKGWMGGQEMMVEETKCTCGKVSSGSVSVSVSAHLLRLFGTGGPGHKNFS